MVRRIITEVHKAIQSAAIDKADSTVLMLIPQHPKQELNIRLLGSGWARLRYGDIKAAYKFDDYGA